MQGHRARQSKLFTQKLFAHVFQNVNGALDSDFSRENGVFIFDAENAFEAHVHVGLDDGLPKAGAVPIADSSKSLRGQIKFVGSEGKIQNSVFIDVLGKENGVLHVRVENRALFSKKVDDFDRIAALPEEVAQIAVRANLLAGGFAELHEGARIIDDEVWVHLEGEALDAVLTGEFRGILPVRHDSFFPLPVLHLAVFGRPAIGNPIRLGILGSAARTAGEAHDHFYIQDFGEKDSLAKRIDVFLGMLGIGMDGVAMATESGNANPAVFKLFQPGFCFTAVGDEVVERTMRIVRIASRANLHGLKTEGGDFVQHGVERQMFVDRIEHADGNLAQLSGRLGRENTWKQGLKTCRMGEHFTPGNGSRQQAAGHSHKLPPSHGGVLGQLLHASPRQTLQWSEHQCFRRIIRQCDAQTSVENRFSIGLKSKLTTGGGKKRDREITPSALSTDPGWGWRRVRSGRARGVSCFYEWHRRASRWPCRYWEEQRRSRPTARCGPRPHLFWASRRIP